LDDFEAGLSALIEAARMIDRMFANEKEGHAV
jgi:hypothetical protein